MSFDYNSAEKAVLEVLEKAGDELKVELIVSEVIEQDFGWVFLYEAQGTSATASTLLVFDKTDGTVYVPGSADTIDSSIEQYRRGVRTRA